MVTRVGGKMSTENTEVPKISVARLYMKTDSYNYYKYLFYNYMFVCKQQYRNIYL